MISAYRGVEAVQKWLDKRAEVLSSARLTAGDVSRRVADIIERVRKEGDIALGQIAGQLHDAPPRALLLDSPEVELLCAQLPHETKETLEFAAKRIRSFALAIMEDISDVQVEFDEYRAGMHFSPVKRVACYVPGGRYPLPSTALMTAITATVAGVQEVYILTPAPKDEIFYAAKLAGASKVFILGGAQAVAAAAFGTSMIPRADMIVGPGNAYVTEAKRQLLGTIGIDMLAGPSEVAIIADSGADPRWVCLDLLSQAEHDPEARCYLLTDSPDLSESVSMLLPKVIEESQLPNFIEQSVSESAILVLPSLEACAEVSDAIAPEHLALNVLDPLKLKPLLHNFGALFMGRNATVPYGDYCAGPNHTLPTGATARFSSGLTPLTFLRTQTWLDISHPCQSLAEHTGRFAAMEGLLGHRDAALARLKLRSHD